MRIQKISILCMCLVSFLFVLSACTSHYEQIDDPIRPESTIQNGASEQSESGICSIIEQNDKQTVSVHYPVTGYAKIDEIIAGFSLNRIELFKQETANIKIVTDENLPYELHMDYEITYQTSRHISILFTESKYLGSLQPEKTIYTYNFNIEQERLLSLKDIFKGSSAYLEVLSQYVYEALINENVLNLTLDKEWVTKGSQPLEANFKHFLLVEGGVQIFFEKYQLGPAFIGEPILTVPFDVFTAHIELKEKSLESEVSTTEPEDPSPIVETTEAVTESTTDQDDASNTDPAVSAKKRIAITFEDGPHPIYTPLILDTLKSRNEEATFFLIGKRAFIYTDLTKRIYDDGHLIGSHSWNHPQLTRLSNSDLTIQFNRTNQVIQNITGFTPFLYRPPYGIYNEAVLESGNMPAILWSIDPLDMKFQDSEYIKNYVLDHAFDGAIIMLHDNNPYTTQALSAIIDGLIKDGFEIVSLDELLDLNASSLKNNTNVYSRGAEIK